VIAQKILDPNKTMAVDTEDIGPIISHGTGPLRLMLATIRALFGSN
jgi:hypothetical protein